LCVAFALQTRTNRRDDDDEHSCTDAEGASKNQHSQLSGSYPPPHPRLLRNGGALIE
jgi:hypothetical protein